jgi:Carbon monoxide dehydrogenase subunit G (CoxG).
MTAYESDIKTISSSEEEVFTVLSDLRNLQKIQDKLSENDTIKDLQFDADSCSFSVQGVGKIGFRIIQRDPTNTIVFAAEDMMITANAWIQLKQVAENDTRMKLTLKAELPQMMKMLIDKKLKDGINMIADKLAEGLNSTM